MYYWFELTILCIVAVVFLLVTAKIVATMIGLPCHFCSNQKCTPFLDLPEDKQAKILDYFWNYEDRDPDKKGIFVCCDCNTVYDDFSGEKRSMELDKSNLGQTTFCKVCNQVVAHCELENDRIRCVHCKTRYSWEVHEKSGCRFLMPPEGIESVKDCNDIFGNA